MDSLDGEGVTYSSGLGAPDITCGINKNAFIEALPISVERQINRITTTVNVIYLSIFLVLCNRLFMSCRIISNIFVIRINTLYLCSM